MATDRQVPRSAFVITLLLTAACATTQKAPAPLPLAVSPSPPPPSESTSSGRPPFSLFTQLTRDARNLATAPLGWERSDWTKLGIGALAVGGALLLDEDLREIVHRNTNDMTRGLAKAAGPFGAEYSFATLGAFYLAGTWGTSRDSSGRAGLERPNGAPKCSAISRPSPHSRKTGS